MTRILRSWQIQYAGYSSAALGGNPPCKHQAGPVQADGARTVSVCRYRDGQWTQVDSRLLNGHGLQSCAAPSLALVAGFLEGAIDRLCQGGGGERLGDVVGGSCLPAPDAVLLIRLHGQKEHGKRGPLSVECLEDAETVSNREHDVEQDRVGTRLPGDPQTVIRARRLEDLVSVVLQVD